MLDGMYAVTVHPGTGRATGRIFASGHNANGAFYGMEEFLRHVQQGRVVIFCTLVSGAGWNSSGVDWGDWLLRQGQNKGVSGADLMTAEGLR